MLFNSIEFAIFLPVVFAIYWFLLNKNLKLQNLFIVFASYLFYGWWDWRFLFLIIFSTVIDYSVGLALVKTDNKQKRKFLLWLSIFVNLGLLGFFKYYNFFLENFVEAFSFFGNPIEVDTLSIVLPVGISFYTFQTLSYTIDIYKKKLKPTKDIIAFSAFVSFFPQLVAGPIERARNLLPQFYVKRKFNYNDAVDGLRQILWGLFKKVVIADGCAQYANVIFNNSEDYTGSTLVLGALFFTFQIYGDFSGYSDIAIGTSRLFGFKLSKNFAFPYFSRNMAEFWRRWHISLSTWFRDYLYIPIGGSRGSNWNKIRNLLIIFIVSGFWHGANWTFIIWGALNAFYVIPLVLSNKNRNYIEIVAKGKNIPTTKEGLAMFYTFCLFVFAWIFFRANNLDHAVNYISEIFSTSIFTIPDYFGSGDAWKIVVLTFLFVVIEWIGREGEYAIEKIGLRWKPYLRYFFYYVILAFIVMYWLGGTGEQFIYFQF